MDLGVGVGWQREEYEAAGLSFEDRGRLLDHTLEVCRDVVDTAAGVLSVSGVDVRRHSPDAQAGADRRRTRMDQWHRQQGCGAPDRAVWQRLDSVGFGTTPTSRERSRAMKDKVREFGGDPD